MSPAINFQAAPRLINGWTVLELPAAASAQLPSRGQVMVEGELNGQPLLAPLEPDGKGGHWLRAEGLTVGAEAQLSIRPTKHWPEPNLPDDFTTALTAASLQAHWASLTPMARWEWLRWINSTDQPETRQRRIEVSCSKMKAGERRPCCFNRSMCCVPAVSKGGVLLPAIL